ncbi:FAD/NAD(P)-binding domain-containing protein [Aspergillus sclerotiicarbonarius CBS 121057]|uniref:FAD/NAD(P)-binding domain-containing protein n=1 Tax=Aspergillus sclerotiicarbonarius (strain CBS 121057 / IBT 28362) TaxID=1448318 RepID=A0A319ET34_ASPSB|nr:FAD/NAD(P)-binding domain-containing protein [Aspergillus sclerotiicarbonarius CBS 121057]
MSQAEFTVIIVGGSIAGLAPAHCLHHANIRHIVLEKSSSPAPQKGASIGMMPNGARILDQLGLWVKVEAQIEPLGTAIMAYPDGFHFTTSYPKIIHDRFGYPIAFLDRQQLLQILYEGYPHRERILLSEEVIAVESFTDKATVTTASGKVYTGHLVVGADGVHSRVRTEIWRAAESMSPGLITAQEKASLTAEYRCIFGMSSPIPGLMPGEQVNFFSPGLSIVTVPGKLGRVYWFLMQKLDRKYTWPNCPRFTDEDIALAAAQLDQVRIYKEITFGHVWKAREAVAMTPLEEGLLKTWSWGRMVLIGDSLRKVLLDD